MGPAWYSGIEQLHFVPPGFAWAEQLAQFGQLMFDHVVWHYSTIMIQCTHVNAYTRGNVSIQHVVQTLHIGPRVGIAIYNTGTIYQGQQLTVVCTIHSSPRRP
jgi:hypothetical protein